MDSKQYTNRARALLHEAHELHQRVADTMTELGDDASTSEWQTLYGVMNAVGIACDIMRETLNPHRSAFAVPMVCVTCRTPVTATAAGPDKWEHADELDEAHCETWNAHLPVMAMVAEGSEHVTRSPLDTV